MNSYGHQSLVKKAPRSPAIKAYIKAVVKPREKQVFVNRVFNDDINRRLWQISGDILPARTVVVAHKNIRSEIVVSVGVECSIYALFFV